MHIRYNGIARLDQTPRQVLRAYRVLVSVLVFAFFFGSRSSAQGPLNFDKEILRAGGIGKDDASLLNYFRHLSPEGIDPADLGPLVARLSSKRFADRERASRALIHQGVRALPALRKALTDSNIEASRRARACIDAIEKPEIGLNVVPAAVRALVKRRVPGAVEALLRYLPFAPAESLEEDVVFGLDALALREGKLEPALAAALSDRLAPRRAAAACIVGHRGSAEQRAAVRKMLTDPSPLVRLRAAQGLLAAGDGSGLPVLAALVAEPDVPLAWQAEELLHWVAGDQAPAVKVGAGAAETRRKCRAAWEAWCRKHAATVDFAVLRRQPRRPLLLAVLRPQVEPKTGIFTNINQLAVFGYDGKVRWELSYTEHKNCGPLSFQWLAGGRFLVPMRNLEEHDLNGKVIWSYPRTYHGVRRLWNGATLVFDGLRISALGPTGKEAWSGEKLPGFDPRHAWPLGNRQILMIPKEGLDRANSQDIYRVTLIGVGNGQVVQMGKIAADKCAGGVLPDGTMRLIAFRSLRLAREPVPKWQHFVEEYDLNGKIIKQWPTGTYPCARLHNGHDLLLEGRTYPGRLSEVDSKGRVRWEVFLRQRLYEVRVILRLVRLGLDDDVPADLDLATLSNRIKGLRSPNALERGWSAWAIGELGSKGAAAGPALVEALADRAVTGAAENALRKLGPAVVPHLIKALKHKEPWVRIHAVSCLNAYKTEHVVILPALLEALKDEHPVVRARAAHGVSVVATDPLAAVRTLTNLLADSAPEVRAQAAVSLGQLGVTARPAIPALIRCFKDKDRLVRIRAANSIGLIGRGSPQAITALVEALQPTNPLHMRCAAAGGLGRIGLEAKVAVPLLVDMLDGKDAPDEAARTRLRDAAAYALGHMGPAAKPAIKSIINLARRSNRRSTLRIWAIRMLGTFGPDAKEALPVLREAAQDRGDAVAADAAVTAIKSIE